MKPQFVSWLPKNTNNEYGFGLLTVVIALAILGIMISAFMSTFSSSLVFNAKISRRGELEDLRRYIRNGESVSLTKAARPAPCHDGTVLAIKRPKAGAAPLIKSASGAGRTKIGGYFINAKCTKVAGEFQIFYSKFAYSDGKSLFSVPRNLP